MVRVIAAETCPVRIYDGVAEHSHRDFYEMHFFTKGRGVFHQRGSRIPARPGTWCLTGPKVAHRIERPRGEGPMHFAFIQFRPDDVSAPWLATLAERHPVPRTAVPGMAWDRPVQEMVEAFGKPTPHRAERAGHLLLAFLFAMADLDSTPGKVSPLVAEALVRMDEALVTGGSHRHLARDLGVDPSTLWRAFHRDLGASPVAVFQGRRLEQVRTALVETREPIARIAERFGYTDGFHLSRDFRKRVGVSPRHYRQRGL